MDKMFELAKKFISLKTDKAQVFFVWGHSYEFDIADCIDWEKFEELCSILANREDIFYGTNKQVLLGE